METELNCGKRRRRIESARPTGSLTFLRIRVSDEDVVAISVISRHADGCSRIRPTVYYDFGDYYRPTCDLGYTRVEVAGGRVRVMTTSRLRAIEHQPHKPEVNC